MPDIKIGDTVRFEGKVIDTTDDSFHTRPQVNVSFNNGQYPRWIDADILEKVEEENEMAEYRCINNKCARFQSSQKLRKKRSQENAYRCARCGALMAEYIDLTYDRVQVLREEWKPRGYTEFFAVDSENTIHPKDFPYTNILHCIFDGSIKFAPTQALAEEIVAIRKGKWEAQECDPFCNAIANPLRIGMSYIGTWHESTNCHYSGTYEFPSFEQRDTFIATQKSDNHLWTSEDQIKIYNNLRNILKQVEDERDVYKAQVEALKLAQLIKKEEFPWVNNGTGQRIATIRFDGSSGSMGLHQLAEELKPLLDFLKAAKSYKPEEFPWANGPKEGTELK